MTNSDDDYDKWLQAQSFQDLCELSAQFIEGTLKAHPSYAESIDAETIPLVSMLAEFNRKGFLTTVSQPAEALDDKGNGQRAFVDGFAPETIAKRIARLGLFTDLYVIIAQPNYLCGYMLPVTLEEFHPFTWCGKIGMPDEREFFAESCGSQSILELEATWNVCIIDLKWGREDYLWRHVKQALDGSFAPEKPYSITPSSSHDLDTDFYYY